MTVEAPFTTLRKAQLFVGALIALVMPAGALAVFGFNADRSRTADAVGVIFFVGLVALFSTPWWPLATRRGVAWFDRLQSMCLVWFVVSFAIHLTWELAWLILHRRIATASNQAWAYPWWMYIDGGDSRYAHATPTLLTQEFLSVLNGLMGVTGLMLWWRSKGWSVTATMLLMATGVVHIYSATLYFGSEVLDGYPHVNPSNFASFWVKFWLLNGLWILMPVAVFVWGRRILSDQLRSRVSEEPAGVSPLIPTQPVVAR